jgi:ribosome-associated protein
MIRISTEISLDEKELVFDYVRSSGPGGQNINKVSTAVQLRFNAIQSKSLPDEVKKRLSAISGKRMTDKGEIVIEAKRFRTQAKNREDALQRLITLLQKAAVKPKLRKKTKPSVSASAARVNSKKRRGVIKRTRSYNPDEWE